VNRGRLFVRIPARFGRNCIRTGAAGFDNAAEISGNTGAFSDGCGDNRTRTDAECRLCASIPFPKTSGEC
jgi:hypothetical protein